MERDAELGSVFTPMYNTLYMYKCPLHLLRTFSVNFLASFILHHASCQLKGLLGCINVKLLSRESGPSQISFLEREVERGRGEGARRGRETRKWQIFGMGLTHAQNLRRFEEGEGQGNRGSEKEGKDSNHGIHKSCPISSSDYIG